MTMSRNIRAGIIGSTGKGDYGHGLDTAFQQVDGVQVVALADDHPEGVRAVGRKLGIDRLYRDYRQMLAEEELDLVSIGPRWVTERIPMITAAAAAGCHIYCEKPLAGTLEEADIMVHACRKARVKAALAHQFRGLPPVRLALQQVKSGTYGKLLRMRARPKDDHRGGGEELMVHGTHLFDLMIAFAGEPQWVCADVMVGSREATLEDRREGTEPAGPMAGDSITALFGFPNGVRATFDSVAHLYTTGKLIYGVLLECERAMLHVRRLGDVYVYPAPQVIPDQPGLQWEKMMLPEWHLDAHGQPCRHDDWLHAGNQVLVRDLITAIEEDRQPPASIQDAQWITEMIQGVYASHFLGGRRVRIPLEDRRHPLLGADFLPEINRSEVVKIGREDRRQ